MSAEPMNVSGVPPFANQKIRLCSRNRPRTERTVIVSLSPGTSGRTEQIHELLREKRQQPIHPLRERLDHEVVAVLVDDQRRQQVGLSVHQPVRVRLEAQRFTIPERRFQPAAEERFVRRLLATRQHPARDL